MSISMLSYGIHKFEPGDIDTFIDIGAESGSVSYFVYKELSPSRIIALEPCKENFENLLKANEEMGNFTFPNQAIQRSVLVVYIFQQVIHEGRMVQPTAFFISRKQYLKVNKEPSQQDNL